VHKVEKNCNGGESAVKAFPTTGPGYATTNITDVTQKQKNLVSSGPRLQKTSEYTLYNNVLCASYLLLRTHVNVTNRYTTAHIIIITNYMPQLNFVGTVNIIFTKILSGLIHHYYYSRDSKRASVGCI
jgi:hypothetical protein